VFSLGYSGFNILNCEFSKPLEDYYVIDQIKFKFHYQLCQVSYFLFIQKLIFKLVAEITDDSFFSNPNKKHFEKFISSHKDSDTLIDILLSTSLPILVREIKNKFYFAALFFSNSMQKTRTDPITSIVALCTETCA